jgi:LCP family protein required for cell wall assembly
MKRLFRFIAFRVIPVLLLALTLWFGYGAAQNVTRRISEQTDFQARAADYSSTATALAPILATATPSPAVGSSGNSWMQPVIYRQVFATNTLRPEDVTPTPLPQPQATRPLPTLFVPPEPNLNANAPTAIPTIVPALDRHGYDLVNILLMGTDQEITNDKIDRTDTMIILSINRTTNTVSMLSLPRDLYVYIPGWTMQRLNLAYTRGEQVGWTGGGFGLLRQTIFYNFGINVHYYVLINLTGFKQVVDTLGGVDLAVDCAIQDQPLVDAPPPPEAVRVNDDNFYVLPVGYYHMAGGGALWYARSRHSSSDFDRGRRQQQLIRAIFRKARESGQLAKLPELWGQITQVVKTDLKLEDILGLLPIALSVDPNQIEHYTLRRLYDTTPWQPPDGSNVQLPNYDHIRELLEDFYTPPTENQSALEGGKVLVYNGTTNANWDRVAAERLGWDGLNAFASGSADKTSYNDTVVIDHTGKRKGGSLNQIVKILNVKPENIVSQPDPNRQADYEVILGSNYNSCTEKGVLPVDQLPTGTPAQP